MKEIKVYIDELPENCSKCEWSTLNHKDSLSDFDCPLKSLHDNNKELVAKVLRKAKSLIIKYDLLKDYQGCAGYFMLDKIIDQIQKDIENG